MIQVPDVLFVIFAYLKKRSGNVKMLRSIGISPNSLLDHSLESPVTKSSRTSSEQNKESVDTNSKVIHELRGRIEFLEKQLQSMMK